MTNREQAEYSRALDRITRLEDLVATLVGRLPTVAAEQGILVGKAPSKISKGSTGTFNVWRGLAGAAAYTTGDDKQVYARLGDIPTGSFTYIKQVNGGWEAVDTENCP